MINHTILSTLFLMTVGCSGDKNGEEALSISGNGCTETDFEGTPACDAWFYNIDETLSNVLQEDGSGIVVNIASSAVVYEGEEAFLKISTSGIPDYDVVFEQSDIDALNVRPNASTDFENGETTAQVGVTYSFGSDIGYRSNSDCETGAGYGWWPPGPVCPTNQYKEVYFPLVPSPAEEGSECETGLGALGLFVNGVSIYNWSDGASYNNEGIWMNVAAQYEAYDLGPCRGHAANGDYHHHDLSTCLMDQVGESGNGHSEVYGMAADGYLIYGPYVSANTIAQSCWVARDYNDAESPYGCGGTGERSCVMVDVFDPTLGTTETASNGPTTSEVVTSMSGNNFVAVSGFYKEDYYFDATCSNQGLAYLDEHNGHEHDDLGYHYHITYTFPYFTGPILKGSVPDGSETACDGVSSMGQGGGPGGPGGPGGQQ